MPGTPPGGSIVLWEQGNGLSLVSGGLHPFISGDVNSYSFRPLLDHDGSEVQFVSAASNLVEGDTDGDLDLFTWGSR